MAKWKSKADWKDRNWVYVNAASTDIRQTIERVRREMQELENKEAAKKAENVTEMKARKVK